MTIVSRLNTVINDHATIANVAAFGVLASITIISAAAINRAGEIARVTFDTPVVSTPAAKPVASAPIWDAQIVATPVEGLPLDATTQVNGLPLDVTAPLNLQSQRADVVNYLQAAQGAAYVQATTNSPQSGATNMQLTGANPQNTAGVL